MKTHLAIVRRLADGAFHSGEALADELDVSRAAVWKAVRKAAEALGLDVESVRGRGYRLVSPLELLERESILDTVPEDVRHQIARLEVHDHLDSTNSHLMRAAHAGAPSGSLCLAERQSAGRGRRGRSWVSPFGTNVYLSLLWRYPCGPAQLGGLSLVAGIVVAEVLAAEGVEGIGLKWPNDVLWRRRKLAGLLIEVAGETQGPSLVIMGVGLNTRLPEAAAAAIDQPWTDLDAALGPGSHSRNRLAGRLVTGLLRGLRQYGVDGLAPFLSAWDRYDLYRGERVELRLGDRTVVGVHRGIGDDGALRLEVDGALAHYHAGEVSLRSPHP